MRNTIFTGISVLLLSACNNNDKAVDKKFTDSAGTVSPPAAAVSDTVGKSSSLSLQDLPGKIIAQLKGKPAQAHTWTDKNGQNILVLSASEGKHNKPAGNNIDENGKETPFYAYYKELYAADFIKTDTGYRLLWKLSDREENCEFDLTAEFIKDALSVTDLDKDGIAETAVQYKLACRSDVSPAYMKLIMYEDTSKYVLRGLMWVKDAEDAKFTVTISDINLATLKGYRGMDKDWYKASGRYENEKGFTNAPPSFLQYAKERWLKFAVESF